jgi:predicted  nucleic acid-binding Zn-ribbon protein
LNKLKSAESNNKKRREAVMKEMEKSVKDSQKVSNTKRTELVAIKNRRDAILAEIKACNNELNVVKDQRMISESAVTRLTEELASLTIKVQ